ncbi:MAG TPA: hypothetical protein VNO30_45225 [Kofleriaceae bacterium]|nr:hypothetical protein [Kofleriaceae bacterium]
MSRASWLARVLVSVTALALVPAGGAGCGGGGDAAPDAADVPGSDGGPDGQPSSCLPAGVTGELLRRAGNPRLLPGQPFGDGKISVAIADPDVRWDAAAARYELYYSAPHAAAFGDLAEPMIRRATSPDRMAWTIDDAPVLRAAADLAAWDSERVEAPSVVYNPAAPPDRRYLMLYAGAAGPFPHPGYGPGFAIGAAFSADGVAFTRVPAAASPHGKEGLVLTGAQVYRAATGAIVSDPELALIAGVYHLWFSSLACSGAGCASVTDLGVGHATSADGITWMIDEAPVRALLRNISDRRSGGRKPAVVYDAARCRYDLWLTHDAAGDVSAQPVALDNTAGVYYAESTDGRAWLVRYDRPRDLQWTAAEAGEGLGLHAGVDVAQNGTGRLMLYVGYDDEAVPAGFTLIDRAQGTPRPGVMTLNVATRDLP